MYPCNRIARWSIAATMLALSPLAAAETMIYITGTQIGTVDSATPGTDTTNSNSGKGPLSYVLPNGSSLLGAAVSLGKQTLYLLLTQNGMCQLYSVDTNGSNGAASLSAVDASYACAPPQGTGDFAFLSGSGGTTQTDAYLVAAGSQVLAVPAGGGAPTAYAMSNANGGSGNVWGVADEGDFPADTQFGVDAEEQQLFQLGLNATADTGTETNVAAFPLNFSGPTSLDYSVNSQTLYLFSGSVLYAYGGVPYPNNLSDGAAVILGSPPPGTLAMVVGNGAMVTNNSGALTPATLLPLLGMAWLRRRRARAPGVSG
jgi:hypothetical protein